VLKKQGTAPQPSTEIGNHGRFATCQTMQCDVSSKVERYWSIRDCMKHGRDWHRTTRCLLERAGSGKMLIFSCVWILLSLLYLALHAWTCMLAPQHESLHQPLQAQHGAIMQGPCNSP
jgi:hypothetical protein